MSVTPAAPPVTLPIDDAGDGAGGALPYNKLCNLGDFAHPDLVPYLTALFPESVVAEGPEWPARSPAVERKMWEIAMAIRTFADFGLLNDQMEILGVGAGTERTSFELTNHVRRVFATDLYAGAGQSWIADATTVMLHNPAAISPLPFNPRRLVVQHMDALELQYDDNSFDAIFSSSSIEHFGTLEDVHTAAREMHRVLKPGGILSLSTEFRLAGPPPGIPGALLMTPEDLQAGLIGDLGWALVSPPDFSLSEATGMGAWSYDEIMRLHQAGEVTPRHIVLWRGEHFWTSVHLALVKDS
jgi:SAM-dependent methyltransferase